jgi:hypothetical protein
MQSEGSAQASLNPFNEDNAICPVPTCGGKLVSLKHVYASWRKNTELNNEGFSPFYVPTSTNPLTLADPNQILLIHTIMQQTVTNNEPPFKIQFMKDDGEWHDIAFIDQIRIAAVMFDMRNKKCSGRKLVEHRLLHNNQLIITVSFEQGVFKFDIYVGEVMQPVESQLIVLDGSFEIA